MICRCSICGERLIVQRIIDEYNEEVVFLNPCSSCFPSKNISCEDFLCDESDFLTGKY